MVRTIDGKPRPFGDDKPPKGRAAVLVAVVVGAAAAGGAAIGTAGGPGTQAPNSGKEPARKGKHEDAMKRLGLKTVKKAVKRELKCAPYAFGEVQRFFLRHPCKSLSRMLLALGDGAGNTVAVTIAWVRMPRAADARDLHQLAGRDGTGNIYALPDAVLSRAGVRFTGEHYASRLDGALVVIAEATPVAGHPAPGVLDDAADVAALFPPP